MNGSTRLSLAFVPNYTFSEANHRVPWQEHGTDFETGIFSLPAILLSVPLTTDIFFIYEIYILVLSNLYVHLGNHPSQDYEDRELGSSLLGRAEHVEHHGHQCACVKYLKVVIHEERVKYSMKQNPSFPTSPNAMITVGMKDSNGEHSKNLLKQDRLKEHF